MKPPQLLASILLAALLSPVALAESAKDALMRKVLEEKKRQEATGQPLRPFDVMKPKDSPFDEVMQAALSGPEKKDLRVFGHGFNVKPAQVTRVNGKITAVGQLSHRLGHRPDDQVYYTIVKKGDAVVTLHRDINRGGIAGIAAPIIAAAGTYLTGAPIPPEQVEAVGRAMGKAVDGSWEGASDFIIANIALRLK